MGRETVDDEGKGARWRAGERRARARWMKGADKQGPHVSERGQVALARAGAGEQKWAGWISAQRASGKIENSFRISKIRLNVC